MVTRETLRGGAAIGDHGGRMSQGGYAMQGAVFVGDRKVELQNFPDPTPGPRDVVLEIKASGMCGSDLKFYRASADGGTAALGLGDIEGPVIGGHEPCGVVAEVGAGVTETEARVGQRVMVHHYHGCGVCGHCRTGWSQLCRAGFEVYGVTANGAHAMYMRAPVETLVPLPETLSFETGAAISWAPAPRSARSGVARCRAATRWRSSARARSGSARRNWPTPWAPASSPSTSRRSAERWPRNSAPTR